MTAYDDYLNSLPYHIALKQRAYDRNYRAWRLRQLGMTFRAIGKLLDISDSRAQQVTRSYRPHRPSPIELWLATDPQFRWDCGTLIGSHGRKTPRTRPRVMAALKALAAS